MQSFLDSLGEEVSDPEEGKSLRSSKNSLHWLTVLTESFLLFSQSIPSQNLGFVDRKATVLEVTINDRDLTIHQSPTILSSNRGGGTTGAGKRLSFSIQFLADALKLSGRSLLCLPPGSLLPQIYYSSMLFWTQTLVFSNWDVGFLESSLYHFLHSSIHMS